MGGGEGWGFPLEHFLTFKVNSGAGDIGMKSPREQSWAGQLRSLCWWGWTGLGGWAWRT